jgi:hypothetical protein
LLAGFSPICQRVMSFFYHKRSWVLALCAFISVRHVRFLACVLERRHNIIFVFSFSGWSPASLSLLHRSTPPALSHTAPHPLPSSEHRRPDETAPPCPLLSPLSPNQAAAAANPSEVDSRAARLKTTMVAATCA